MFMKYLLLLIPVLVMMLAWIFRPTPDIPNDSWITQCYGLEEQTNFFAMFSKDEDFEKAHPKPLEIDFHSQAGGKEIRFDTPDGEQARAFLLKSPVETSKYLFIFHEWWGLNDQIRREAEKFYTDLQGVNVLAIDMYDGKLATNADQARKFMTALGEERSAAILSGAMKYAGSGAEIATAGWCFGGSVSLQAALKAGYQAEACIIYYGMPVRDPEVLQKLRAPVLGIFASQDKYITPDVVEEFRNVMEKAGKELTVKIYDADHAFANPSGDRYQENAAREAYQLSLAFLENHLVFN
jgi:carboxymethylenebutenolidase